MAQIADVVRAYVAAWHEKDELARRKLLADAWREDGLYQDPNADIHGREKLLQHIGGFHQRFPGCHFELPESIDEHHGQFHFVWKLIGSDGRTLLTGRDFGLTDEVGRIVRIAGFFDRPANSS
jgi:hypothetical protein